MRLDRILAFFGVQADSVDVLDSSRLAHLLVTPSEVAVFAAIETLAAAVINEGSPEWLRNAGAVYLYATEDREASERALRRLTRSQWSINPATKAANGLASLKVTEELPDLTGPMSGLTVSAPLAPEDAVVVTSGAAQAATDLKVLMSADGQPLCISFRLDGVAACLAASAAMVDIDEPVRGSVYDVKTDFCSIVPLTIFITSVFRSVIWRPVEHGACLIIDDPLLRPRYGFCDFAALRDLMARHHFTTNIAFIPWNWRRTSSKSSTFFRKESTSFSVSIHGCDHIAGEFGTSVVEVLDRKAKLAQARMQAHQARTRINHDPVMVFPQGVFSSQCPVVLKRNGFLGAVNTEVSPVDDHNGRTSIRDAWDVAIMKYGAFPIFTRRYPSHGVENLAFDVLLGKPCFLVTHHGFFRDQGEALVEVVRKLSALNCRLTWRSPREVIRRACRRRTSPLAVEEVEMYGSELLLTNAADEPKDIFVGKREPEPAAVSDIQADGLSIEWQSNGDHLLIRHRLVPRSKTVINVAYKPHPSAPARRRSLKYEASVAARRMLCEFRDQYVQKGLRRLAS